MSNPYDQITLINKLSLKIGRLQGALELLIDIVQDKMPTLDLSNYRKLLEKELEDNT